jgi:hypothetical protein
MYTDEQKAAWKTIADAQGIVCVICLNAPALQRRDAFYDTGLCRHCAAELEAESAPGSVRSGHPDLA